jgi:hypothetical protein
MLRPHRLKILKREIQEPKRKIKVAKGKVRSVVLKKHNLTQRILLIKRNWRTFLLWDFEVIYVSSFKSLFVLEKELCRVKVTVSKIMAIGGIYFENLVFGKYKRCGNEFLRIIFYKSYDYQGEISYAHNLRIEKYE